MSLQVVTNCNMFYHAETDRPILIIEKLRCKNFRNTRMTVTSPLVRYIRIACMFNRKPILIHHNFYNIYLFRVCDIEKKEFFSMSLKKHGSKPSSQKT